MACWPCSGLTCRRRREKGHEGWSLRILGDIHLEDATLDLAAAERAYREALAIADARGMEPLRAHCHRGLGRLARLQGRGRQAGDFLAEADRLHRAMKMTRWLSP